MVGVREVEVRVSPYVQTSVYFCNMKTLDNANLFLLHECSYFHYSSRPLSFLNLLFGLRVFSVNIYPTSCKFDEDNDRLPLLF